MGEINAEIKDMIKFNGGVYKAAAVNMAQKYKKTFGDKIYAKALAQMKGDEAKLSTFLNAYWKWYGALKALGHNPDISYGGRDRDVRARRSMLPSERLDKAKMMTHVAKKSFDLDTTTAEKYLKIMKSVLKWKVI